MNVDDLSEKFMQLPGMRRGGRNSRQQDRPRELRFPGIGFLPNSVRNHFIAFVGEFCGTFLFLFLAFSATQVANAAATASASAAGGGASLAQAPNASTLLYIALAFGFSLAVNAWAFFRISGGLFNPAVTLAVALVGGVTWIRAAVALVAQLLGAIAASGVVSGLFPGEMAVSTTLNSSTSIVRGLFIEMFLTAELVFTILILAVEKHKGSYLAPIGIGLSLFVSELSGVYFTGGSLNPARSFGPCVVLGDFPGYHWLYWVGPALGSLLAVAFYRFMKILEYETANPGQDFNEKENATFHFDEEQAATGADVQRPDPVEENLERQMSDLSNQVRMSSSRDGGTKNAQKRSGAPRLDSSLRSNERFQQGFEDASLHPGYSQNQQNV